MEKSPERKESPSPAELKPVERTIDEKTKRALGHTAVNGANQK